MKGASGNGKTYIAWLVINMISTGVMIKLGCVSGNLLDHMKPTNKKLIDRAERIICAETGVDMDAAAALKAAGNDISAAIIAIKGERQ